MRWSENGAQVSSEEGCPGPVPCDAAGNKHKVAKSKEQAPSRDRPMFTLIEISSLRLRAARLYQQVQSGGRFLACAVTIPLIGASKL